VNGYFLGRRRRRSLSLDGNVPGIEYNRQHRPYNLGAFHGPPQGGSPQSFQAYEPDPGSPEFHESQYEGYQWSMDGHPTPPLRPDPIERPPVEHAPTYAAGVRLSEFMSEHMQELYGFPGRESSPSLESESASLDSDLGGEEEMGMSRSLDDAVNDQWLADEAVRQISAAMDQQVMGDSIDSCPNNSYDEPPQEQEAGLEHLVDSAWNEQAAAMSQPPVQQMEDEWMQQMRDSFGMMGPMM